jgi:hypothetical protein
VLEGLHAEEGGDERGEGAGAGREVGCEVGGPGAAVIKSGLVIQEG